MLLARPSLTSEEERVVDRPLPSSAELVHAALSGSRPAWNDLIERFTPLVLSITNRYRLTPADAADVSQTVWLQLVQHLADLRDPRALPGWIATTVRHECIRVRRERQRTTVLDPQEQGRLLEDPRAAKVGATDDDLLRQERHEALLAGFAELTARQRALLLLLVSDPPSSYAEISARLGIPIGAIGPTRARALSRLRHTPALAALLQNALLDAEVK